MKNFKAFLQEQEEQKSSEFSIARQIISKLDDKVYEYGGVGYSDEFLVDGKTVKGYLFFLKSKQAFRLDFLDGNLAYIEIWDKFQFTDDNESNAPSDRVITLKPGFDVDELVSTLSDQLGNSDDSDGGDEDSEDAPDDSDSPEDSMPPGSGATVNESLEFKFLMEASEETKKRNWRTLLNTGDAKKINDAWGRIKWKQREGTADQTDIMFGHAFEEWLHHHGHVKFDRLHFTKENPPPQRTQEPSNAERPAQRKAPAAAPPSDNDQNAESPNQGQQNASSDETNASDNEKNMDISAREGISSKLVTPKSDPETKQLEDRLQQILGSAGGGSSKKLRKPAETFAKIKKYLHYLHFGEGTSLVVCGQPGTGKTHNVIKDLESMGLEEDRDFIKVTGKTTPLALYSTLFLNRSAGKFLLFDDCDAIWKNEDAVNILKGALDSHEVRKISWLSKNTVNTSRWTAEEKADYENQIEDRMAEDPTDDSIKLPSQFRYEGKIVFISNLPISKLDNAVKDRAAGVVNVTFSPDDFIEYIGQILPEMHNDMKPEVKEHVFNVLKNGYFKQYPGKINMRTVDRALKIAKSGIDDWEDMLDRDED